MRLKEDIEEPVEEMSGGEEKKCPKCSEVLDVEELNFFPCECHYQLCLFCWNELKSGDRRCPNCHKVYPDNPVNFKPMTQEQILKIRNWKKKKDLEKRQKIDEIKKNLADRRVLQKNLVFIVGLPQGIEADKEKFEKIMEPFKQIGPVLKCMVNERTNYAGNQGASACAYVTYQNKVDAVKAIKTLTGTKVEGRAIKVSMGTTKYCSNFLKNVQCTKQDCMYLHWIAEDEISFTKEEMQLGNHVEIEQRICEEILANDLKEKSQDSQLEETNVSQKTIQFSSVNNEQSQSEELSRVNSESSLDSPLTSSTESDRPPSVSIKEETIGFNYIQSNLQSSLDFSDPAQSDLHAKLCDSREKRVISLEQPQTYQETLAANGFSNSSNFHNILHAFQQPSKNTVAQGPFPTAQNSDLSVPSCLMPWNGNSCKETSSLNPLAAPFQNHSSYFSNINEEANDVHNGIEEFPSEPTLRDVLGFDPVQIALDNLYRLCLEERRVQIRQRFLNSRAQNLLGYSSTDGLEPRRLRVTQTPPNRFVHPDSFPSSRPHFPMPNLQQRLRNAPDFFTNVAAQPHFQYPTPAPREIVPYSTPTRSPAIENLMLNNATGSSRLCMPVVPQISQPDLLNSQMLSSPSSFVSDFSQRQLNQFQNRDYLDSISLPALQQQHRLQQQHFPQPVVNNNAQLPPLYRNANLNMRMPPPPLQPQQQQQRLLNDFSTRQLQQLGLNFNNLSLQDLQYQHPNNPHISSSNHMGMPPPGL
ncbi:CCR4-NOT transcription complex subunit 4, partial [Stegodyphus mimosarum]